MVGIVSTTNAPADSPKKGTVHSKQLIQLLGSQITGRITVHPAGSDFVPWRIYVSNGQIHYVQSTLGQRERLTYFLKQYAPEITVSETTLFKTDYEFLCQAWRSGGLNFQALRNVVMALSQEGLAHVLKAPEIEISFEKGLNLEPVLLSVPIQELRSAANSQLEQWSSFYRSSLSPLYRVTVKKLSALRDAIMSRMLVDRSYKGLESVLVPQLCLYEVATTLSVDVTELCSFLQPLLQAGVIETSPYRSVQNRPLVACIDDSKTVQRNVRLILEASGYQALELMDPTRALTALVRNKPALILMDISMPGVDGYELCRMLRATSFLKDVPIIMLTGRDGVVDRLRARMVGANDYLTKPCEANQLITLIQKLLLLETPV